MTMFQLYCVQTFNYFSHVSVNTWISPNGQHQLELFSIKVVVHIYTDTLLQYSSTLYI